MKINLNANDVSTCLYTLLGGIDTRKPGDEIEVDFNLDLMYTQTGARTRNYGALLNILKDCKVVIKTFTPLNPLIGFFYEKLPNVKIEVKKSFFPLVTDFPTSNTYFENYLKDKKENYEEIQYSGEFEKKFYEILEAKNYLRIINSKVIERKFKTELKNTSCITLKPWIEEDFKMIEAFIQENFPEKKDENKIVKHKKIYRFMNFFVDTIYDIQEKYEGSNVSFNSFTSGFENPFGFLKDKEEKEESKKETPEIKAMNHIDRLLVILNDDSKGVEEVDLMISTPGGLPNYIYPISDAFRSTFKKYGDRVKLNICLSSMSSAGVFIMTDFIGRPLEGVNELKLLDDFSVIHLAASEAPERWIVQNRTSYGQASKIMNENLYEFLKELLKNLSQKELSKLKMNCDVHFNNTRLYEITDHIKEVYKKYGF